MADEIDLERGDPTAAEDTPRGRRRRRRSGERSEGERPTAQQDTEVTSRLSRVLDRIAGTLEARGDDELAGAIREDSAAMEHGLVSLTRHVPFLRMPLLMFLNLIEPVLAFWRVGRILARRFVERRFNKQVAKAAAAAGMTVEEFVAAGYPESPTVMGENGGSEIPVT